MPVSDRYSYQYDVGGREAPGTQPDEDAACELVGYLQCKPVRDRLTIDTITYAEDVATIRTVLLGRYTEQPDWSRVDATEALLLHLLACTPGAARAELFSFLGWLFWLARSQWPTSGRYLKFSRDTDSRCC